MTKGKRHAHILTAGATALAAMIARRDVSVAEVVEASLAAIEALDGSLKAFITVDAEGARGAARLADERLDTADDTDELPALFGVPVAIKDVTPTAGLRTTSGSLVRADFVPNEDALSVARLRQAGAIIIGKTNTPEFAFGARCSNALCGPTATPWDLARSSGGSSGGSAAAVATGLVPLAMGTDFGGSVRTPASFCGCMALRPTPGTIPDPSRPLGGSLLATEGILAREAADLEIALDCLSAPHPMDPASREKPQNMVTGSALRLAGTATFNGAYPVDAAVEAAFDAACSSLSSILGPLSEACPDVSGGADAFKTLRAAESWYKSGPLVSAHEDQLTSSFVWNVRQGRNIPAEDFIAAQAVQTKLYRAFQTFFEDYDLLLVPAASILPFPNTQEEVMTVGGQAMGSIIDYLAPTFLISLVGFPVLCFPAHVTESGLPFGVQIIARPGEEKRLLDVAGRLEAAGLSHRWPPFSIAGAAE